MNQNDSKLNSLPDGWKWVKSNEILDIRDGTHDTPKYVSESKYPLITSKNLKNGEITFDDIKFISEEDFISISKRSKVDRNDILFGMIGTIGNPVIVKSEPSFAIKNVGLFKNNQAHILSKFLNYFLNSIIFYKQLEDRKLLKGTTQKFIPLGNLRNIDLPLPPLSTQAQIVEKLEAVLSELDKGKAQLLTAQAQLKTYRQAVLKYAFEGKLTGGTEGWEWVKTGDIMQTINNGYTPKSHFLSEGKGEIPFIKVYNLNFDGTLNFTKNPTFIPKEIHEKDLKRSICYPNDVLINIVGPPLGKASVITNQFPEWNINQAIVLFRPNEKILSKFLSYFLQNPNTINWLEGTSKATAGQWNVKVSTCREIPLYLPPLSTQEKIVTEIESRLSVCDKLEETIKASLAQCETLRQSVLKRAFEGRLV